MSKELTEQTRIWYAKLKATGFVDIEHGNALKPASDRIRARYNRETEEFYRRARALLWTDLSAFERAVWAPYSEAASIEAIRIALKTDRNKVYYTIRALVARMMLLELTEGDAEALD